jgi:hypothetical protein
VDGLGEGDEVDGDGDGDGDVVDGDGEGDDWDLVSENESV